MAPHQLLHSDSFSNLRQHIFYSFSVGLPNCNPTLSQAERCMVLDINHCLNFELHCKPPEEM